MSDGNKKSGKYDAGQHDDHLVAADTHDHDHDGNGHGDGDQNDDGHSDNGKNGVKDEEKSEKAAEKAEKEAQKAAEKAEKEAQEAAEKAEKSAKEAAEKAEKDAKKASAEKAAAEKAAAEKAAAEKAAAEKVAAEKAAAEKAAAEEAAHKDGDDHSDIHIGDGAKNVIAGDDHDSIIFGEGGKDTLAGNGGDDRMHGGGGDDTMAGDAGNDTMFGSSAAGGKVDMTKFKVTEATTAKVTFNYESAGYQNALGVYKIAADGSIGGVQILFANASLKGSGGDLISGVSSVDVGVEAGQRLGFFVVPNGFSQYGMSKLLSDQSASFKFVGADGKSGNVDGGTELKLVHVGANGAETVVKSAYGTSIFHSVDNGKSGLNGDGINHVTGTVDNLNGTVKIGFEDLKGGGDKDYDDSIFTVTLGTTNTALLAKEATKVSAQSDKDVMTGGTGDDKMFGMADDDKMSGGGGNDKMWGNSGADSIAGGDGNDQIFGGKGDDVISDGAGDDTVRGDSGNDKIIAGEGNDTYDGGSGFDTIDYSGASGSMKVDLNSHAVAGMGTDYIKGVESVVGSQFSDQLTGDKNNNTFLGGDGSDTFRGRGGSDTFSGQAGNDTYFWTKKDAVSGVDHITDFAKGDRLNLHDLLKGQKYSNISDVVKVTDTNAGSKVAVKVGASFIDVVVLDGVHGTSAIELQKAGMILV